jgi:hypothetical protein
MKIIYKKRREGKTLDLIKLAIQDKNACIVCATHEHRSEINQILSEHLKVNNFPVYVFNTFIECKGRSPKVKNVYIDDLDICMQIFVNMREDSLRAVSINKKEK